MDINEMDAEQIISHLKLMFDWKRRPHEGQFLRRALELLKEKEPVDIETEGGGGTWWSVCGECHGTVDDSDNFCRHCGRPFRKKRNGCDGCTYKDGEDCPLNWSSDRNVYCPNGRLR